ncbi:MATE family efflux transporter, partial [Escherichia coli]|uniref:MATE family efflux transporter n=1 Tax=Escherichia coli TaxID=562 RepID=UPI0018096D5B
MFGLEAALFAIATLVVGRSGVISLAAHQVVLQTTYAAYMGPQGISQAAAVRVARAVAADDRGGVRIAAWTAILLGGVFMLGASTTDLVCPGALASIFIAHSSGDELESKTVAIFAVAALYQV